MESVSGWLRDSLPKIRPMTSSCRRLTPQYTGQFVRRHLADKKVSSAFAEEFGLQPSQIHQSVITLQVQADKASTRSLGSTRIRQPEAKLATKNEVIAERLEENFKSKGELGEF
jgi:transposase-like protein